MPSLVGSEMCIRDSPAAAPAARRSDGTAGQLGRSTAARRRRSGRRSADVAGGAGGRDGGRGGGGGCGAVRVWRVWPRLQHAEQPGQTPAESPGNDVVVDRGRCRCCQPRTAATAAAGRCGPRNRLTQVSALRQGIVFHSSSHVDSSSVAESLELNSTTRTRTRARHGHGHGLFCGKTDPHGPNGVSPQKSPCPCPCSGI